MSARRLLLSCLGPVLLAVAAPAALAQITVTATNPSAAAQGTVNLNVSVSGNGFKKGAKAKFYVSGTTDTGGVTVNSTAFNGSSSLTANITIANAATLANFDVQVMNSDGRTGVGSELFTVTPYGTPNGCSTTGTPSGFTLVTTLNPVNPATGTATITTGILGNSIRVRPVDLSGNRGTPNALVAFVSSGNYVVGWTGNAEGTYVFLLDPATGNMLTTNPVTGAPLPQNPIEILSGFSAGVAAAGDVNGDGIPDFVLAGGNLGFLFVGGIDANKNLYYTAYRINPPANAPLGFGASVAMGDLDGQPGDEFVIGANAAGSKGKGPLPAVFVYNFSGSAVNLLQTISDPTGTGGYFGNGVAIGNVAGDISNNLIVGAYSAGTVYVFHPPLLSGAPAYFTLTGSGYGLGTAAMDIDQDSTTVSDLVVTAGTSGAFYPGPVNASSPVGSSLVPVHSLTGSWDRPAMDIGILGTAGAVIVGAQTANNNIGNNSCSSVVGAAHLFLQPFASVQPTSYLFEPPTIGFQYGSAVAVVNGYPFVFIGEHFRDVGTTTKAGQLYVYRKN